ncbi:hypothetical protein KSP39_PZI007477 [Platanthera zijinensis]|uniref:Uncharacterized protein n=1 Tax=Platanthera zijinensis TaxID=2320716 RepID=A0AAP0G9D1_9ASPA
MAAHSGTSSFRNKYLETSDANRLLMLVFSMAGTRPLCLINVGPPYVELTGGQEEGRGDLLKGACAET